MISLEDYKKALGKKLINKLTEEKILKLRDNDDRMTDFFKSGLN